MEALSFLAAPFALTILLVGIHAYLGLHVLEREVIFVDISLSQVAALGGAISLSFVHEEENTLGIFLSLGLCLLVAFILALFRKYEKKISQEALIGITYAFASGSLILIADRLPHGAEHLKEALIGNILFVTWPKILLTFAIYSCIGILHYIFRKKFWACSRGENTAVFWDFLFYLLFGIVITFSTRHAGVLVVFSILVVPASLAVRFKESLPSRLGFAWIWGVFMSAVAFLVSYRYDLPAGAAIVAVLTGAFFITLVLRILYEKKSQT